jgi:hypothetical protein
MGRVSSGGELCYSDASYYVNQYTWIRLPASDSYQLENLWLQLGT